MLALGLLLAVQTPAIDATTLRGKVICGYQGWFRTPKDGGWFHWSRDRNSISPSTVTFEMWPDVSEYPTESLHQADDYKHADGCAAQLFSSTHPGVVDKHFEWMREYGLDGVFVQRFLGGLDGAEGSPKESVVLRHARDAAAKHGRIFAVEYDMSGTPPDKALEVMKKDWTYLVQELGLTKNPRYLHHQGKPVLAIFGFFTDRMSGAQANAIIDHFEREGVALVGAGQWWWRNERDPEWHRAFRRFTAYSPWDVGNVQVENGIKKAPTHRWADDLAEAKRANMMLLPVLYPGFSWDNLKRLASGESLISRRKGDFLREQFRCASALGVEQAFVAMFDEVDEATAIFKVSNDPPTQGHFLGLDGMAPDSYLKIVGEGTRTIREAQVSANSGPSGKGSSR